MTAIGLIIGVVAISLIWAGITGKDAIAEYRAAFTGTKKLA